MIEEPLPDLVCLHVRLLSLSCRYLRILDRPTVPVASAGAVQRRDEAQPHRATRIVPVQVDQHDALPGAQQRLPVLHRHRHRRGDQPGQHVVGAVAGRTVRVPVAVVARQQPFQRVDQVVVGTRAGLDDRHAGRRVRDEDVAQPVAAATRRTPAPRRSGRRCGGGTCRCRALRCSRRFEPYEASRRIDARVYCVGGPGYFCCSRTRTPGGRQNMTITGIITAILIGIVVGVLGRLVLPGKQPIGMLLTSSSASSPRSSAPRLPARSASRPRPAASTGWNCWSRSSSPPPAWHWSPH